MDYKTSEDFRNGHCIDCKFYDPEKECFEITDCWYDYEEDASACRKMEESLFDFDDETN